jgi:hypothetical protein
MLAPEVVTLLKNSASDFSTVLVSDLGKDYIDAVKARLQKTHR